MGKRTEHAPGTFSWVDLSTSDAGAAKSFYGPLFGWEFDENEIPESDGGGVYTMCTVDGSPVCAITEQKDVPPHWNNYVTVEDADAATAKAKDLGANSIMEPFDVMTAGRMGVFADPTGAALCLWQPKESIGAELVNAPGALTWNELHTADLDAASSFYGDLFGWKTEPMDTGDGPEYRVIHNGDRTNGGMMPPQGGEPPNWLPYFAVEDLEGTISKATESGGKSLAGPIPMPAGKIAVLQDPQGAAFALWQGELAD